MKEMRPVIFHILIVLILLAAPRAQAAGWCNPDIVPKVSVKTDTDRIKWVFNKSQRELNNQEIDTVSPYGKSVITDVGGLMQGGIEMAETMKFNTMTNPNTNELCMYYNNVQISFHIFPTIYIASEHPRGTCMHQAIKNHELKHINVDRQIVNKYAQAVGNAVQTEIRRQAVYGPAPVSEGPKIQAYMKSRLEQILVNYSKQMDAERRTRQQAIDTLQEYEAVQKSCRDRGF